MYLYRTCVNNLDFKRQWVYGKLLHDPPHHAQYYSFLDYKMKLNSSHIPVPCSPAVLPEPFLSISSCKQKSSKGTPFSLLPWFKNRRFRFSKTCGLLVQNPVPKPFLRERTPILFHVIILANLSIPISLLVSILNLFK